MTEKPQRRVNFLRLAVLIVLAVPLAFGLAHLYAMWLESQSPAAQDASRYAGLEGYTPLSKENPPSPESFAPRQVVDAFPPITDIPTLPAKEAAGKIDDNELVLGIELNGQARAYPINMLTGPSREIFNDELGGRPIAATW